MPAMYRAKDDLKLPLLFFLLNVCATMPSLFLEDSLFVVALQMLPVGPSWPQARVPSVWAFISEETSRGYCEVSRAIWQDHSIQAHIYLFSNFSVLYFINMCSPVPNCIENGFLAH